RGREVHLRTVKIPIVDPETGRSLVVGISEDITEQVKSQQKLENLNRTLLAANHELQQTQLQLIQAEKLESIGRLAAGVAHEVKNPLALLLLGVDYLSQGIDLDDPNVDTILSQMREAVERADRIVRGLVDFSSQRKLGRESAKLDEVIDDALLLVKHELTKANVAVSLNVNDDLPKVPLDVSKFEQVLINLIINSVHAMEDTPRPRLAIHLRKESLTDVARNEGARKMEVLRSGDEVIVLEIIDNGCGITQDDSTRVFDPFFTTKATGHGTGLGLSVSKKIVALHNGKLTLTNREDGKGAIARIVMPTTNKSRKIEPVPARKT
ncbi:MAG: ATP-binding protein, partial [Verrucomicrobiota bacterium]